MSSTTDQQVTYPTVDDSTTEPTQSTTTTDSSSSERLPLTPLKPASKNTPLLETVNKVLGKVSVIVIQPIIAGFCFAFGQFFLRKVVYYTHYENLTLGQTLTKGWETFLKDYIFHSKNNSK